MCERERRVTKERMGMCSVSRLPALAEMGSGITAHAQREVHTKQEECEEEWGWVKCFSLSLATTS